MKFDTPAMGGFIPHSSLVNWLKRSRVKDTKKQDKIIMMVRRLEVEQAEYQEWSRKNRKAE